MPMKQFLVLVMRTPRFDPALIPAHRAFLEDLKDRGALDAFGPFSDQSGGAYLIRAESLEQARAMAFADPLHAAGLSEVSVREWKVTRLSQVVEA